LGGKKKGLREWARPLDHKTRVIYEPER
jgi:hypothetical protein